MKNTIFLKDVQAIFDKKFQDGKPVPFDLVVFKYSRTNKTGGDLRIYNGVVKPTKEQIKRSGFNKKTIESILNEKPSRNPNHFKNKTRCIMLPTGEIRKISLICIKSINNLEMIY